MKVCSFCGKNEDQVKRIVTSPKADICGECVIICMEILVHEFKDLQKIEFYTQSQNVKIDKNDRGCCALDCPHFGEVNKIGYCNLYKTVLHGEDSKTRCGQCYLDWQ